MADHSKIEWTDATWNPITGCSVVSPGCTNCYAMRLAGTRLAHHASRAGLTRDTKAGPVWTGEVRFNEQWLDQPLRWRKSRMIFVCAHGDLFAEGVATAWLDQIFAVMALCPQHVFQVLTKRPERLREYLSRPEAPTLIKRVTRSKLEAIARSEAGARDRIGQVLSNIGVPDYRWPLPNVWLGVSVEDQTRADARIPVLLDTPAAVRWISAEPLLDPVNLRNVAGRFPGMPAGHDHFDALHPHLPTGIDWIVAGGESGPGARPMHPDWVRSLRDQCAATDVPFHFKQWGQWSVSEIGDGGALSPPLPAQGLTRMKLDQGAGFRSFAKDETVAQVFQPGTIIAVPVGKKRAGRTLDGVEHNGFPEISR